MASCFVDSDAGCHNHVGRLVEVPEERAGEEPGGITAAIAKKMLGNREIDQNVAQVGDWYVSCIAHLFNSLSKYASFPLNVL